MYKAKLANKLQGSRFYKNKFQLKNKLPWFVSELLGQENLNSLHMFQLVLQK